MSKSAAPLILPMGLPDVQNLPTYKCTECFTLSLHSTEIRVISGFLQFSFAPDSSQAASSSHVANAVFATGAPRVEQQGNKLTNSRNILNMSLSHESEKICH